MPIMTRVDLRPQDPSFHADPLPIFRQMQDHDPVHYSPHLKSWVLTFASLPSEDAQRIGAIIRYLSLWLVLRGMQSLPLRVAA